MMPASASWDGSQSDVRGSPHGACLAPVGGPALYIELHGGAIAGSRREEVALRHTIDSSQERPSDDRQECDVHPGAILFGLMAAQ